MASPICNLQTIAEILPFEKLLNVMTTLPLDIPTYTTITLEKLITKITEEIKTPLSIIDPTICSKSRTDLIPVVLAKLTAVVTK